MRKPFAGIFAVFYLLCSLWSGLSAQTEDELVDDLSALIRLQTVTRDNDANRAAMEWIVEELAGLPIQVKWYESKGLPSVVITSQETTSPKILLAGHLDVVPGTEESFQPKVEDGRLIGRGAYDMKMGIAAALNIFKALGDDLNKYDFFIKIPRISNKCYLLNKVNILENLIKKKFLNIKNTAYDSHLIIGGISTKNTKIYIIKKLLIKLDNLL